MRMGGTEEVLPPTSPVNSETPPPENSNTPPPENNGHDNNFSEGEKYFFFKEFYIFPSALNK